MLSKKLCCRGIVRAFSPSIDIHHQCVRSVAHVCTDLSMDMRALAISIHAQVSWVRGLLGPPSFAPALGVFSHLRSRAHQLFVTCSPSGLTRLGASSLGFPEASLSPWPSPRLGSPRRVCPTGSSSSSPDARDRAGVSFVGVSRSPLITPRAGAYCWNRFGRRLSFGK